MSRRDNTERNQTMRELRASGLTLREIGEKFGVTREAVRRAVGDVIPNKPPTKKQLRLAAIAKRREEKQRHLEAGDRWCYRCGWLPEERFGKHPKPICSDCNRTRAKAWIKRNPERRAEQQRMYIQRKKAKKGLLTT